MRLCTGRTAHGGGGRDITLLFLDHGARRWWRVSVKPRPLFTPGKDPIPIVQEVGWAPGLVWKGVENLAPTGIRSPDRPVRSQSLCRLRYPAHNNTVLARYTTNLAYELSLYEINRHLFYFNLHGRISLIRGRSLISQTDRCFSHTFSAVLGSRITALAQIFISMIHHTPLPNQ